MAWQKDERVGKWFKNLFEKHPEILVMGCPYQKSEMSEQVWQDPITYGLYRDIVSKSGEQISICCYEDGEYYAHPDYDDLVGKHC